MCRQQSIQVRNGRVIDIGTTFPRQNLFSQPFPKLSHGLQGLLCDG
jgi:hypothetical protein